MELSVTVDAGKVLLNNMCILEGNGMLFTQTYFDIQEVVTSVADAYYPNLESVAKDIASNYENYWHELAAHAKQCAHPATQYIRPKANHPIGDIFPLDGYSKQPGFAVLTLLT